ncbi:hypothetical protein MKR37_01375 [Staphylococcus haemolyticus]|uniref:hypothetical protein n=1 Tax=Staphylococcus haemolyticus TaxID=1283 RepID=UPI001F0A8E46|nr:hypothetical protein [Staphylococcus haemolyticus]MCH4459079.1 hypothetical protein [Staphylococcus haemolyticus]MCH4482368.1 hypothetical protein [Staphylococcus haemolyticus]
MKKFVSEDIFEDENVPKHNLKSMMLNNDDYDDYDDSHTAQFDFIFLSVIFIPLIILFLIFIH